MNKLIIFDFDGTLININHLHKTAWESVLAEVGLEGQLSEYLPYERFLLERFDSSRRILENFFSLPLHRGTLEFYFRTNDKDYIVNELLDLKESHLLYTLDALSPSELAVFYAKNIFPGLDALSAADSKMGIISNTRETIIHQALSPCNLDDCFQFVIGEESLGEAHHLGKQHPDVRKKIPKALLSWAEEVCYVGDDPRIDSLVARNLGIRFLQVPQNLDFVLLRGLL